LTRKCPFVTENDIKIKPRIFALCVFEKQKKSKIIISPRIKQIVVTLVAHKWLEDDMPPVYGNGFIF